MFIKCRVLGHTFEADFLDQTTEQGNCIWKLGGLKEYEVVGVNRANHFVGPHVELVEYSPVKLVLVVEKTRIFICVGCKWLVKNIVSQHV